MNEEDYREKKCIKLQKLKQKKGEIGNIVIAI